LHRTTCPGMESFQNGKSIPSFGELEWCCAFGACQT